MCLAQGPQRSDAGEARDIDVTVHAVSISVIAGGIRKINGNGNHQDKSE